MNIEKKSKAVEKLEHNAKNGEVLSAFQLFEYYRDGKSVPQDDAMAAQYLAQCFEYVHNSAHQFCLEKLELFDFRRFEHLEVKLHPELTVLIGDNGSGKTSILEAISKTLSNIANEILKGSNGKELSRSDVNNGADKERANIKTVFGDGIGLKFVEGNLSVAKTGKSPSYLEDLKRIGRLWLSVDRSHEINLPCFVHYSDKRNCHEVMEYKRKEDRFDGYREAFDDPKAFGYFMVWYIRLQRKVRSGVSLSKFHLTSVDAVICSSLNMTQIYVDTSTGEEVVWFKTENGADVRFEQMSAGQKALTALFGDIARRLILLNPKLDNPLEGQGIVLVDEIELHLHPKWQQGVLLNLQKSFPNIQFIVTTHSPQVLSTVDKSNIRKFTTNEFGQDVLETPKFQTKGVVSKDILEQIMGTHAEPNIVEARWFDDYSDYLSRSDLDAAEALLYSKIIPHFGSDHPVVLDCLNLKSIHEMKKRLGVVG